MDMHLMFIEALYQNSQEAWKQPKCPCGQRNKRCHTYKIEIVFISYAKNDILMGTCSNMGGPGISYEYENMRISYEVK